MHRALAKHADDYMKLEQLTFDNLEPALELVTALWQDCSLEEERINYRGLIGSDEGRCFLVKDENKYVAFLHVGIRRDYVEGSSHSPVAYIEGVYVKPDYREHGIGKWLVNCAEDWALGKGLRQIASDTEADNVTSIEFHRKAGFQASHMVCFIKDLNA